MTFYGPFKVGVVHDAYSQLTGHIPDDTHRVLFGIRSAAASKGSSKKLTSLKEPNGGQQSSFT